MQNKFCQSPEIHKVTNKFFIHVHIEVQNWKYYVQNIKILSNVQRYANA